MKNYKDIIRRALDNSGKKFTLIDNHYEKIAEIVHPITLNWFPTYIASYQNQYYMFSPFSSDSFIDDDEIKREIKEAQKLMKLLKSKKIESKQYFIVDNFDDVEVLSKQTKSKNVSILFDDSKYPILYPSLIDALGRGYKLLPNVLEYLANSKNLQGEIGQYIKKFAKKYSKVVPGKNESKLIKKAMNELLKCDKRFCLESTPIDFMGNFEKFIAQNDQNIRDHYFHAFNTMLLGFLIIEKAYKKFSYLAKKIGDDIAPEFLWLLISLYHDIGYPIPKQEYLIGQTYGLNSEVNKQHISNLMRQQRQEVWKSDEYNFIVKYMSNLFYHLFESKKGKWICDPFPISEGSAQFRKSLKESFVDEGAHGAGGAIKLGLLLSKPIKPVEMPQDRQFFYRHILSASISILFHDYKVRKCFKNNSINEIKAENFAFSLLLTYVDILQDDRRDISTSYSRPDILKDVKCDEDIIIAKLNEDNLGNSLKGKLFDELNDALSFFRMNGIDFKIPEEILNN